MTQNRVSQFRLADGFEGMAPAECPDCEGPLGFHQPDPQLPLRLLAACHGCKSWYLIDLGRGLLFRLPGVTEDVGEGEGVNMAFDRE